MKVRFKLVSTKEANTFVLAHSIRFNNLLLKKGKVLNKSDISDLLKHKITKIYVAIKSKDDYSENYSAKSIANHISSSDFHDPVVNNGRADLFSRKNGMLKINKEKLFKINSLYSEVAVCTLKNYSIVKAGQLVGNVKILPYAMNKKKIEKILNKNELKRIFKISTVTSSKIALIFTSNNIKNLKKEKVLKAIGERLKNFNLKISFSTVCNHNHKDLSLKIKEVLKKNVDLLLIYGESSICDLNDVVPTGILKANGRILSCLLPTDPGNLLLLGKILKSIIIGVPGCAKSLQRNGFDDVLERVCHGENFTKTELTNLADGGLYKNIIRKFDTII